MELHVGLARREPDLADEDVAESYRRSFGNGDGQFVWSARLASRELNHPLAVLSGHAGGDIAGETAADLDAGKGRAGYSDGLAPLEDHVVSEDVVD